MQGDILDLAPCVAIVGPANAGKSTLIHQLDSRLQRQLKAFLVIKGSPDGSGHYLFHAPEQREILKSHIKGSWAEDTVAHISRTIDASRQNLELALLDFGGKHDPANELMLRRCTHYIVVSRLSDDEGGASWDRLCRNLALRRIAWMRSIGPLDSSAPFIQAAEEGFNGAFRYDVQPGQLENDGVMGTLANALAALRRAPDLVPYIDLHDADRWEESHIPGVRGRAARIREMAERTGVVLLGGAAPVWAYLSAVACALKANPQVRIFFFDPQQPERLVEIPPERSDGPWPEGTLELRWNNTPQAARLEIHLLTKDRFLPPAAARQLMHAPGFGEILADGVCLWGRAPAWLHGAYARWLIRAGLLQLSVFDAAKDREIEVYLRSA